MGHDGGELPELTVDRLVLWVLRHVTFVSEAMARFLWTISP